MQEEGGLYLDFDNDPEGIISRTVSIMVISLDTTSEVLPDPLLKDLFFDLLLGNFDSNSETLAFKAFTAGINKDTNLE